MDENLNKEKMEEPLISRIPGSKVGLEEDDPNFAPIDNLLYWLDYGGFERCQFKYKGVWYVIHCDAWEGGREYYFAISSEPFDEVLMTTDNDWEIIDSPLLPDGKTPRQALCEISFDEYQNI